MTKPLQQINGIYIVLFCQQKYIYIPISPKIIKIYNQKHDDFRSLINTVTNITLYFFDSHALTLETFARNKLRNNSRGYQMSSGPEKRTCPIQIYSYPSSSFFGSAFLFFLLPLLPRFRSVDILPVPIVKHPRRRYAIVAF